MFSAINNRYVTFYRQYGISDSNRTVAKETSFSEAMSKASYGSTTTDSVLSELKVRFGAKIYVEAFPNMGKDSKSFQRQLNSLGSRTFGMNNIVIAPNILEKMAKDPEAKQYYTKRIHEYFNSCPAGQSFLAAAGHQIISSGVIVHEDGTVTSWCNADLTPEKKAEIEQKMKEEDEAKAKKRTEYENWIRVSMKTSSSASKIIIALNSVYTGKRCLLPM